MCGHTIEDSRMIYDIIHASKTLFKQRDSDSKHIVLSKLRSIFGSKAVGESFIYFCLHGAATAWVLQNELRFSEATAHRVIQRLNSLGFVVLSAKADRDDRSLGGTCHNVWALEDVSCDEVAEALRLHYQMKGGEDAEK